MKLLIVVLFSALLTLLLAHSQAKTPGLNNQVPVAVKATASDQKKTEVKAPTGVKAKTKAADRPTKSKTTLAAAKPRSKPKVVAQGCANYRSTFAKYDWNVRTALAICQAESGGKTHALSPTGDRGLMQVNHVHAAKVDYNLSALYNPYTNIRVAYAVYRSQGWNGWTTYKTGAYLAYY